MADTFTPYYNLTKPQVGGAPDTWGDLLNANFDIIDTAMHNNAELAGNAMPKAGGTFTGNVIISRNGTAELDIQGAAGSNRSILLSTGASLRWRIYASTSGESGTATGSNLGIARYDNSGTQIDIPFSIERSTGAVQAPLMEGPAFRSGINFGGQSVPEATDLSRHIQLHTNGYGISVTSGNLNLVAGGFVYSFGSSGDVSFPDGLGVSGNAVIGGTVNVNSGVFARSSAGTCYLRPNGAGSTSGQLTLSSSGIASAADFQATSDARLKKDVRHLWRGVEELKSMPPREYVKDGRREVGFIAQEVMDVLPEAVSEGEDGYLTVSYGQLVALVASAVLDLDKRMRLAGI